MSVSTVFIGLSLLNSIMLLFWKEFPELHAKIERVVEKIPKFRKVTEFSKEKKRKVLLLFLVICLIITAVANAMEAQKAADMSADRFRALKRIEACNDTLKIANADLVQQGQARDEHINVLMEQNAENIEQQRRTRKKLDEAQANFKEEHNVLGDFMDSTYRLNEILLNMMRDRSRSLADVKREIEEDERTTEIVNFIFRDHNTGKSIANLPVEFDIRDSSPPFHLEDTTNASGAISFRIPKGYDRHHCIYRSVSDIYDQDGRYVSVSDLVKGVREVYLPYR